MARIHPTMHLLPDAIQVQLPLFTPKQKIRAKRPVEGYLPSPLALSSRDRIAAQDYLEWQIGYFTKEGTHPSLVREIQLGDGKFGCELTWLLKNAVETGAVSRERFEALSYLVGEDMGDGIQEAERIATRVEGNQIRIAQEHGFSRSEQLVPLYTVAREKYSIEIRLAVQQRGVEIQAMVFLRIPLVFCAPLNEHPALLGRKARPSEMVGYTIDFTNSEIIDDTIRAFAIASITHRHDLRQIVEALRPLLFPERQ